MAGWTIKEHIAPEVREVLIAARDAGYLVKDVAEAAGIEPNKMTRVGTGKRELSAPEYVKLQRTLALTEPWSLTAPKYPNEATLAAMVGFFLEREKAGHTPADVLADYALVMRSVLLSIQAGVLVETDLPAILSEMSRQVALLDRKRQIEGGS